MLEKLKIIVLSCLMYDCLYAYNIGKEYEGFIILKTGEEIINDNKFLSAYSSDLNKAIMDLQIHNEYKEMRTFYKHYVY